MPIITFNKADFLKGQPLTPGWYKAKITNFEQKTPKGGSDSLNYKPTFALTIPGRPADEMPEIEHTFNSKAIGMMIPFIAAKEGKTVQQILDGMTNGTYSFDTDSVIGIEMQIKVENEMYEGRLVNKIKGFLNINDTVPF